DIPLMEIRFNKMKTKLSKKRAISTVLTTVIILVSSVVLGSGVVLYGTSLFQGGTQSEAISVSGVKVWVHATEEDGLAWGAAKIRNTGDKVVSIDTIQIRGSNVPFSQWYPDTTVNSTVFQQSLHLPAWSNTNGMLADEGSNGCTHPNPHEVSVTFTGVGDVCAAAGSGPVGLTPGSSAIIYFKMTNGTVTTLDSGASTTLNIFAGKAGAPQSITIEGIS
ncbi:MAG TPA: hypothetical protein VIS47_04170, partial [Nitrosopumilus sp.]